MFKEKGFVDQGLAYAFGLLNSLQTDTGVLIFILFFEFSLQPSHHCFLLCLQILAILTL